MSRKSKAAHGMCLGSQSWASQVHEQRYTPRRQPYHHHTSQEAEGKQAVEQLFQGLAIMPVSRESRYQHTT